MTRRAAEAKYRTILESNGYELFSTNTNDSTCWISANSPDINVCNLSGLWSAEDATDHNGFGCDAISISTYLEYGVS